MLIEGTALFHANKGILVDDKGHPDDLAQLVEEVFCTINYPIPDDVRAWLQRDFFPFHLKLYSKGGRKAPIYWPLSVGSGSFTLWLYYPRLTSQTLYTAVNDLIEPKLKQVNHEAAALRTKGSARTREDERSFEALQSLELELIEMRDTLLQIAPSYCPNHDDGVQITVHDRSLLGDGAGDSHNFTIPAEKVGIRGDFARFGGPRSMAPYRRGVLYFHGGASLQEAIVPILAVRLRKAAAPVTKASVTLSYKNGAKRITTRLPVVDLAVETGDMLTLGEDIEILLEAHDKKGAVVGEAKPGGPVNVATGTIVLKPGHRAQVTVRMEPDFEGKFALKALNPTTLAVYTTLELETDYAV